MHAPGSGLVGFPCSVSLGKNHPLCTWLAGEDTIAFLDELLAVWYAADCHLVVLGQLFLILIGAGPVT